MRPPRLTPIAVSPADVGVLAHCRRTAAVGKLIAHHLFLPAEEKDLLCAASLLHHHTAGLPGPKAMSRLLADVFGEDLPAAADDGLPGRVQSVVKAYNVPGSGTTPDSRLAGILRLAEAFDQEMEAQPIEGEEVGEILERLGLGVEAGLWPEEAMNALSESTSPPVLGAAESWHVPVFPQAALRTLDRMRDPLASLAEVVEAAGTDPATAGLVMRLANSALFGARAPVSTLAKAIGRLGFATSQRVITSAALGPLFHSHRLQDAWRHSLEVADLADQLASRTGTIHPAEAYLAGLMHDVGRIALLAVPLYDSARLRGLLGGGCPPVYAESLLLRTDHGALGAEIARLWRLPESMVSAVRHHHRPEMAESPLACLLYAAEYLSGSEEDLPSMIRLDCSLRGIGLTMDDVSDCTVSTLGRWLAAA